jgi:N utilization substance protein A
VLEVRKSSRGPVIVVSRTHPHMLRRLLEMEVPEISQGLVEIKAIAREAGRRAKVAVGALRDGVDPVGACVGLRGVRIQSIVRDLNDEKIDVIEWNPESATFIAKALSPARVSGVYLDEDPERGKTAMVVVPEDQLSLAIGRAGVNARLAARLTGWRIDIKSLPEAASESFQRLDSDPAFADVAEREAESRPTIEAILARKAENRPLTPEEYQVLTAFVDRIQRAVVQRREATRQAEAARLAEIRAGIPPGAYVTNLEDVGLSTRVFNVLHEAGYTTAGRVLEQLAVQEDAILGLEGVGPKAIEEIRERLAAFEYPEPVTEVEAPAEVPAEAVEAPAEAAPTETVEAAAPVEAAEAAAVPAEAAEPVAAPEGEAAPVDAAALVEKAFETIAQDIVAAGVAEEDEEEGEKAEAGPAKKKKAKKPSKTVEFDPVTGAMVVKRRRKRGEAGWEEEL